MSTEKQTTEQLLKQLEETKERIKQKIDKLQRNTSTKHSYTPRTEWPSLETTLKNSGWYAERRVNIDPVLEQLKSRSITPNHFAIEFITSFNELLITFPRRTANETYSYHFNAISSLEEYHNDIRDFDEKQILSKLCPVGVSEDKMVVLLIAETGKVYASVDTSLEFVANTYQEALVKLNRNEPFIDLEE